MSIPCQLFLTVSKRLKSTVANRQALIDAGWRMPIIISVRRMVLQQIRRKQIVLQRVRLAHILKRREGIMIGNGSKSDFNPVLSPWQYPKVSRGIQIKQIMAFGNLNPV